MLYSGREQGDVLKKFIGALLVVAGCNFIASGVHAEATLVTNVKGYTLDESGALLQFRQALIEDGKIAALDPASVPQGATVVDGGKRVMLPGMIDAHGHLLSLGAALLKVDVREAASADAAAKQVADYAGAHPELAWLTGRGWNQELWPDRSFPRASILDKYIGERPVSLSRVDGHALWVNSKALALAGITRDTPDPAGGQIVRDGNGEPTGVLVDNAMDLMGAVIPKDSPAQYQQRLDAVGPHLLSLGITGMHDAGIGHDVYDFYLARAVAAQLPLRIYAMIISTDPDLPALLANGPIESSDDFLVMRSVKVIADGALGSRGAALLEPYSDMPHQHGLMVTAPEQFKPLFDEVIGAGFQLNIHAIGDRANHLALQQFADTFSRIGGSELRNRVEHAQVIAPQDLSKFAELGVLPSMQPTHATSDMNMAEDRIGKARMVGAYAWHTLLDSGVHMPLGSDFPVELANPFYGLHAAVTRQDRNNQPLGGWYPEQKMTRLQAFKGFTLDAAYGAHMEDSVGTLTPGKWADFILVDQDIFEVSQSDIWKTQVLATWLAGKPVYLRD